jgi:ribonuclease HI
MAMLPAEHPLHKIVKHKCTHKIKRHKAPLSNLLNTYRLDPTKIEKIPTTPGNLSKKGKLPFKISIAEDRDSSIKEADNAEEVIQVFTDGSAVNGKVGVAAILFKADKAPRTLHIHLGSKSKHTVHKAELAGILLGIHLISTEKHGSTLCVIGVDNQAAMRAFQLDLRSPGHHIAKEIIRTANQIQKRRRKSQYSLTLRWTAGHEGIKGNEAADKEAKAVAEGRSSDKKFLPSYLRKALLMNPSAIKRAYQDKLKKEWKDAWMKSARGQKATWLDDSTPSRKFLNTISRTELSREAASRIVQFRILHVPINQFLKRIGRTDSKHCPACGAEVETIRHFLLTCPSYVHERWILEQKAKKGHKSLTLETLLGNPDMAILLANFIDATERFKQKGERNNLCR